MRENKYDLRPYHRVGIPRFEAYYMKNSISYRGSIAWNLLDPSVASTRAYTKIAINSQALRNLNFTAEWPQMSTSNDNDFVFYWLIINYYMIHDSKTSISIRYIYTFSWYHKDFITFCILGIDFYYVL